MNDKIILVNPPSSMYDIERFLPLGLLAVGSCIKNKYKNIHIEDLDNSLRYSLKQNEKLNYQALAEYIVVQNPSIVGFTAFCNNLPVALYLAKLIKKQNNRIKILFGGPQPSMVASELIKYFDFVDVICRKETETFIVDLIDKILSNNNIHSVPGITFKEGSTIVENPIPVLIENLDDLPYLDFSLIDPSNYDVLKHPLEIGVEAGRGCPFHCDFCSTSLMWSKKHRVKSVQRLFEEMKTVSQFFNVDSIALIHDNFTVNNKYISDFCKLLLENESSIKWRCSSRADHLDDQLIDLMSQAHCKELFFGIETGSQRLQNKIHKRLNLDTANKTINSVSKSSINCITSFIVGHIDETADDLEETLQCVLKHKLLGSYNSQLHLLGVYSGTKVYDRVYDKLYFNPKGSRYSFINDAYKVEALTNIVSEHPTIFSSFYEFEREQENYELDFLRFLNKEGSLILNYYYRTLFVYIKYSKTSLTALLYSFYKKKQCFSNDFMEYAFSNSLVSHIPAKKKNYIKNIFKYEKIIYDLKYSNKYNNSCSQTLVCKDIKYKINCLFFACKFEFDINTKSLSAIKEKETYNLFVYKNNNIDIYDIKKDRYDSIKQLQKEKSVEAKESIITDFLSNELIIQIQ